jgi:hypothetical protein
LEVVTKFVGERVTKALDGPCAAIEAMNQAQPSCFQSVVVPYRSSVVTESDIHQVVEEVVSGEAQAWGLLWEAVEPRLLRYVSSPRVTGRLSQDTDECRNIVVEVMARLNDDGFRRLRMFVDSRAQRPDLEFWPWLMVVTKRVAIDYQRGHGEYIDRRRSRNTGSAPGLWLQRKTLPTDSRLDGARPPITNYGAAMAMLRFAYRNLPEDQLAALEAWIVGSPFATIASDLSLGSAKDAEKTVRAALQRLRRHFRGKA